MSKPPSILQSTLTAPAPAPPPPNDVPWWGALILAVLVSVVSVVGTIYVTKSPATAALPGAPPGFGGLLTDLIAYLPHVLILFGILADIFTLQGAYSIPSLAGLCSLPLNKLLGLFWDGIGMVLADAYTLAMTGQHIAARPPAPVLPVTPGCEIAGFEFLRSDYAPQGLVVTSTVFWFYLLDLMINRNPIDSAITWGAFVVFFGAQAYKLRSCSNLAGSFFIKLAIAFVEGFAIGGTAYGIVQATIPSRLPSAALPTGPNLSSLTKSDDGTYKDASGTKYILGPDGRPLAASFIESAAKANAPAADATTVTTPPTIGS